MRLMASLAAATTLLWIAPAKRVEFRPEKDTSLSKRFETKLHFDVEEFGVFWSGNEVQLKLNDTDPEDYEGDASYVLGVEDLFVLCGGGRPLELRRRIEELTGRFDFGGESHVADAGELQGATVRFQWDEENGSYEHSAEGELDAELLALLDEDLDLRALLPAEEVSEGTSWEIPWSELASIATPGVNAAAMAGAPGPFQQFPPELVEAIADAFSDAHATCTYVGESDGQANIRFESTGTGSIDLMAILSGSSVDIQFAGELKSFDVSIDLKLEGELRWDLAAGHFKAFDLTGQATLDADFTTTVKNEAHNLDLDGEANIAVDLQRTATAQ
jgi:hypothetical protein